MKATLISITAMAASPVLKALHTNNLTCKYVGLDQAGRILMEVTFEKEQEKFINEINKYIEECEEFSQIVKEEFNKAIEKYNAKSEKEMQEHKKKWQERKEKRNNEILA